MNHISEKEVELSSDETGAGCKLVCKEEIISVDAVTESSVADLLLANAKILAVGYKVLTAIAGGDATGFSIGVTGTVGRFATGVSRAAVAAGSPGTVVVVADSAAAQAAAAKVILTQTGGTPTAPTSGRVRVSVWQLVFTAPSA